MVSKPTKLFAIEGGTKGFPWDHLPSESVKAYRAFKQYLDIGDGRTIQKAWMIVYDHPEGGQSPGFMYKWSADYDWSARVAAYDVYMNNLEQSAREEEIRKAAAKWAERRESLREAEFEVAEKLLAKAREMVDWPLKIVDYVTDNYGRFSRTIIHPTDWKIRDIATLLNIASKIGRAATEIPDNTGRAKIPQEELRFMAEMLADQLGITADELMNQAGELLDQVDIGGE